MKKYLLLLSLTACTAAYAQVPEDALRYSFYPQNGTARNLAVGGVMGSLGGDINATFVNPAGLGFYKTGEFVITPGFYMNKNKAAYKNTNSQTSNSVFGFGPTGIVLGMPERYNAKNSKAFSIAVTQTANFNKLTQYSGFNNKTSLSQQFAEEFAGSGYSINDVLNTNSPLPYTAGPALYTYLIDTANGRVVGAPESILNAGQALYQKMNRIEKGGITEIAIGFAHNSNDKWFIGGSIGIPIIYYSSNTTFSESDTSSNTHNGFKQFTYNDKFKTTGAGINARIGVIYRPQEYIRIGLAIHTPTFMDLKDTHTSNINTNLETPSGAAESFAASSTLFTNGEEGVAKYSQRTPFKAILSASYVFREVENVKKQKGFISADIEYVHHKGSRFSTASDEENAEAYDAYYKQLNAVVKNIYKGAFNFRVGGEVKFNIIMARLGFAYYGNPYKDASYKANRMLLSGGLGYRDKGFFVDLTYVYSIAKDADFPYRLQNSETYATTKQMRGNVVATVGVKF